jgi:hypothetical protein
MIKNRLNPHNASAFQHLLDNGLDISTDLSLGFRPPKDFRVSLLDWSVFCGCVEITRSLLETGKVDVEEYDVWKQHVLDECENGFATMELLEEFGVR